ncbi:MAG: NUDIX domain-containing protein [Acidimicrobiia bacterium]|nr:NUDIX domain-containing protein [Acidimicrobiia bacterium]
MTSPPERSAGILLFRTEPSLGVLIGHPGGPFWRNKHEGAWSIPKGLVEPGEDERNAALREFAEETGVKLEPAAMIDLGEVQLRSGKVVVAWAVRGDLDASLLASNPVRLEWPRGSGRVLEFPEIDEFRWCSPAEAGLLLNERQEPLLRRLEEYLDHEE